MKPLKPPFYVVFIFDEEEGIENTPIAHFSSREDAEAWIDMIPEGARHVNYDIHVQNLVPVEFLT